ncbi:MAG: hypothetical protein AAF587_26840 [Bacteroidota bacterium]
MGRTKLFDEQDVLQKALLIFWENGYQKTTWKKLETGMAINPFSIKATFENKKELYRRVLKAYEEKLSGLFLTSLKEKAATIEDIHAFLHDFGASIHNKVIPNGCMMVGAVKELDGEGEEFKPIILRFFQEMKGLFIRALQNSVQQEQIPADTNIDLTAEYLIGITQSLSTVAKVKPLPEIEAYITFAIQKIVS